MIDLEVLVEQFVGPAGGVDGALVAAALGAELDRLLASGSMSLPAESVIDVERIRIDPGLLARDRLADPSATGIVLARAIVDALLGGGDA